VTPERVTARPLYGHYADLSHDVRPATSWRDRLGYLFMTPDWQSTAVRAPLAESSAF
jgi:hypothetical protein